MGKPAFDNSGLRGAFREEVRRSTHATAVAGGLMAIIAMPAWAGFDHLVDPQHADTFTAIRLGLELPLIALWLSLFTGFGRRHPELIMLIFLTLIEASIAFMLSRVEEAYAPYSLGISLAIYASAFLLIWPWQYTAALVGLTWLAVAIAIVGAADPLSRRRPWRPSPTTSARPRSSGSSVSTSAQASAWQQFRDRVELEREHERNEELRRPARAPEPRGSAHRAREPALLGRDAGARVRALVPPGRQPRGDPLRPRPAQGRERPLRPRGGRPGSQGHGRRSSGSGCARPTWPRASAATSSACSAPTPTPRARACWPRR